MTFTASLDTGKTTYLFTRNFEKQIATAPTMPLLTVAGTQNA
jgi:hypothetical protein